MTQSTFEVKFAFVAGVLPIKLSDLKSYTPEYQVLDTKNKAFEYFLNIFEKSLDDCKIEIQFKSDDAQNNEVRTNIMDIISSKTKQNKINHSLKLAKRLAESTDERAGKGLLLILEGYKSKTTRILLSRFKADSVIYTKHSKNELIVDFLEEAFTKKSNQYKSAVYEDIYDKTAFWKGYAIDKQITTNNARELSSYWITDFLLSQSAITNVQGTNQLARNFKNFLKKCEDVDEQQQVITAIMAIKSKVNTTVTIDSLAKAYLSNNLYERFKSFVNDEYYLNSVFNIDSESYEKELGNTVIGFENGVILTAPTFKYEEFVHEEAMSDGKTKVSFSSRIKSKILSKRKIEHES